MLGVDAEFGNGFLVGGNGDKMLGDVLLAGGLQNQSRAVWALVMVLGW